MKIPETGITLLREVAQEILATPKQHDMDIWHDKHRSCGTAMCIAGRIVEKVAPETFKTGAWTGNYVQLVAARAIGLSPSVTSSLFLMGGWPVEMRRRSNSCGGDKEAHAKLAVERIEQFITEHS